MLPIERHRYITEILSQRGRILVQEVAQLCRISLETARRDLALLEKRGVLLRSHGGAVFMEHSTAEKTYVPSQIEQGESFRDRSNQSPDSKTRIAKRALQFINTGDCLLLDSSSSSWFLARQLPDIQLVVLTNSVHIIQTLAVKANVRVIGLGGEYSAKYEDFVGVLAEQMLKEFVINKLFFSCHGICHEGGIRESNEHHARLKQQMLLSSEHKILLADSSKFGRRSFARICHYREIDTLITDHLEDEEFRQELAWSNVNVIEVSPSPLQKKTKNSRNGPLAAAHN
ncbi:MULTISPECIES: DeoR/GlpR family DNA-binding transcription regulator [Serratia]|jgi:DeoR family L-fucose operon activator|uniref:DeoR/GlpR transcriptional regulator n=1 Tax=Serratia liquefaciens TaxID=614 RepID=A0ABX7D7N4_SERLI|nr:MULTISPECIES: DeoR/GlpR family DNA-binding transcription regulator [Serratia]AKE09666.1 DeoR faimly transcriptional regulator [Serratia liquefaciens]AYO38974.1 DeoR/GlpR transcriptional regulator [Serratia sp. P2ACOL2]MBV0843726.1 DeoR/GlpR family DNA-binding transcription regulator [Serratia liquefaciens]MDU5486287.1 DeoR/GlpR family DNA-binding transcription regulator [Serratia liquefaciens]QQU56806.1 DeoR/GlpR transcriptional regulator [Serratia liquefaciens]